ncbi:hypothetical protein ACQ4PT_024841 [Festuca glaucescens]
MARRLGVVPSSRGSIRRQINSKSARWLRCLRMAKRGSPDVPASTDDTRQPKKKISAAPSSVPDDLVDEVLVRPPSRSLARLRCVCRAWNDLISSDAFLERHLQLQVEKPRTPSKLVLAPPARRHRDDGVGELCRNCPRITAARPCRGLVLLCQPCALTYSVCNPSTGGVLHLPPCHRPWSVSSAGIGFHAPTKQYKVVQLAWVNSRWDPRRECHVLANGRLHWTLFARFL